MSLPAFALAVGVLCYLFGLPLLFAEREAVAWRKKFLKDDVSMRLMGGAVVLLAAITLQGHWAVTPDADGIIVFLAWLALLKGLFMVWWPAHFAQIVQWEEKQFEAPIWQMIYGLLAVMIGAFLTYLGLALQAM